MSETQDSGQCCRKCRQYDSDSGECMWITRGLPQWADDEHYVEPDYGDRCQAYEPKFSEEVDSG